MTALRRCLGPALLLLALSAPQRARALDEPGKPDPRKLIEMLENGNFDERRHAEGELAKLGSLPGARELLESKLAHSDSPDLIETIERVLAALNQATLIVEAVDRDGRPLSGAQAQALVRSFGQAGGYDPVTADAAGKLVFPKLKPGLAQVALGWKDLHAPRLALPLWFLRLSSGENRMRVCLNRGGSLKGRVLSADGDTPLENATLTLVDNHLGTLPEPWIERLLPFLRGLGESEKYSSDAKGEFKLEHFGEGEYLAIVEHADFADAFAGAVSIRENSETELKPVRLVPKAKARGVLKFRMLDEKNTPLKEVAVLVAAEPILASPQEGLAELRRLLLLGASIPPAREVPTDKDGMLELKDLKPGAFYVMLQTTHGMVVLPEIKCVAGECPTVDAKAIGSRISGRVTDAGGKGVAGVSVWAMDWRNPWAAVLLADLSTLSHRAQELMESYGGLSSTESDGRYARHAAPGRYSVFFALHGRFAGVRHGVEVGPGKNSAADISLPQISGGGVMLVKGMVVLADGSAPTDATATLFDGLYQRENNSVAENGQFVLGSNPQGGTRHPQGGGTRLMVACQGYQTQFIDLHPGLNLNDLRITLPPLKYGSVSVSVADESGKPLKGATVLPYSFTAYSQTPQIRQTDKKGSVKLTGLRSGLRSLNVVLDGYYLEKPVPVEIPADGETAVAVKLKRGIELSGTVELPPGSDPSQVQVALHWLNDSGFWESAARIARVDVQGGTGVPAREGRFTFSGLHPGQVALEATYPGLVAKKIFGLEVKEVGPASVPAGRDAGPTAPAFKFTRPGGVKIDLGPAGRGYGICLERPDSWNPAGATKNLPHVNFVPDMTADSSGVGEICGIPPGDYDVVLIPPAGQSGTTEPSQSSDTAALIVHAGLKIEPMAGGCADFPKLARTPLALPPAREAGSARGKVVLKDLDFWKPHSTIATMYLVIGSGGAGVPARQAPLAMSCLSYSIPESLDPARGPVVVGTFPGAAPFPAPGEFAIANLPPGDYSIYMQFKFRATLGYADEWAKPETPLRTFTVKEGQAAQLGEVLVEIPADLRERMRAQHERYIERYLRSSYGNAGEDQDPGFKP